MFKKIAITVGILTLLGSAFASYGETDTAEDSAHSYTSDDTTGLSATTGDSTARAMIAVLEEEASRQVAAQSSGLSHDTGEPQTNPSVKGHSPSLFAPIRSVPRKVLTHPFVAGAGLLICTGAIITLIVTPRRRAGREALRFMTTMRLSLMNREVQRACLHIEKNYDDPALSPAAVCAAIVTGVPFLETLFEKELGMSVSAYINQVRLHREKLAAAEDPSTLKENVTGEDNQE